MFLRFGGNLKTCTKCKETKICADFSKRKSSRDGLRSACKECDRRAVAEYRINNPETIKNYYKNNKLSILEQQKSYYTANSERILAEQRAQYASLSEQERRLPGKRYYAKNKAKVLVRTAEYKSLNAARERIRKRQYYVKNIARIAAYRRAYVTGKSDRFAERAAMRRAKKLNATPAWAERFFIRQAYELAKLRTKITGIQWHVDHVVPLQSKLVCGLHTHHNLRVIPASINASKSNRYWPDMPTHERGEHEAEPEFLQAA